MVLSFFFVQAVLVDRERWFLGALARRGNRHIDVWGRACMWTGILLPGCLFYVPLMRLAGV